MDIENMLARGRMDLPVSVCFAAARGDDLLLHQLLKRGMDPNESDNNRRTALVGELIIIFILTFFLDTIFCLLLIHSAVFCFCKISI